MTESSEWVDVGAEAAFAQNRGRRVEVDGTFLAVWRTKERWFASDDACPHMGASLSDGLVVGDTIQCPWHEWRYHVETGVCPVRPWAKVRVHEVRFEGGRVRVRRPERIEKPEAAAPEGESEDWMKYPGDLWGIDSRGERLIVARPSSTVHRALRIHLPTSCHILRHALPRNFGVWTLFTCDGVRSSSRKRDSCADTLHG